MGVIYNILWLIVKCTTGISHGVAEEQHTRNITLTKWSQKKLRCRLCHRRTKVYEGCLNQNITRVLIKTSLVCCLLCRITVLMITHDLDSGKNEGGWANTIGDCATSVSHFCSCGRFLQISTSSLSLWNSQDYCRWEQTPVILNPIHSPAESTKGYRRMRSQINQSARTFTVSPASTPILVILKTPVRNSELLRRSCQL